MSSMSDFLIMYYMWMNLLLDYFTPAISTTYVDVDYGGLDLFRQPDKGMSFALKCVSSV